MKTFGRILLSILLGTLASYPSPGQWAQTGPFGQLSFKSLASSGPLVFAGGGPYIYRSSDGGESWTSVPGLPVHASWDRWFLTSPDTVFLAALTYQLPTDWSGGGCIYRSTDYGLTWTQTGFWGTPPDGGGPGGVYALAHFGSCYLVGVGGLGVYRSTDRGLSWIPSNGGIANVTVHCFGLVDSVLLAGTHGMYRSTDGGMNWAPADSGLPTSWYNFVVNTLITTGTKAFAGTNRGVYLSKDAGLSWSPLDTGLTNLDIRAFCMTGTDLLAGTYGGGIFRSTDSGLTWQAVPGSPWENRITSLTASGGNLLAGTEAGIFCSTDGGANWHEATDGFGPVRTFGLLSTGPKLFAVTGHGVIEWNDSVGSWAYTGLTYASPKALAQVDSTLVAGQGNGVAFSSTDEGATWRSANKGLRIGVDFRTMSVIAGNLYAGTTNGVYLLGKDTAGWVSLGPASTWIDAVCAIGNTLYAIGTTVYAGLPTGIYASADSGKTWTHADSGLVGKGITALYASGTELFVGTYSSGAFHSSDGGVSWQPLQGGLPTVSINAFAGFPGGIFACTASGLYLATDAGSTWRQVSGTASMWLDKVALWDSTVFTAGYFGVWKRPLSEVLASAPSSRNAFPEHYALLQNYPNPFNPTTMIRFSLPHRVHVRLEVFTTLGQTVCELVNGELDAGYHGVLFNGSGLASGTYLYRLEAGTFVETKTMLLLK